jgi:NADH-quinone oxidoreductase subunit N
MLVVVGTALVILVGDLFLPNRSWTPVAILGLIAALVLALHRWDNPLMQAESALLGAVRYDNLSVFLHVVMIISAVLSMLASESWTLLVEKRRAEFQVLVLFAVSGMMLLVSSGDLITLFLSLELMSFPTYVLCGFLRHNIKSNEAALKYFVLGSFASSLLLYGTALLWGTTGTTSLAMLHAAPDSALFILGAVLVVIGFLFKVGAAPFHMWVPDVYEGAPTPVTMFMATGIKVAAFGALYRILVVGLFRDALPFADILWWLACLTMIIGNLSALTQDNIKRLLAFSSVAHAGYMLVGLTAVAKTGYAAGGAAILYYLVAYTFMNIGAFSVVTLLQRRVESDLQFDRDWSGVARRFPVLGMAMTIFVLGLGGLPPTAGFVGKYSLFRAAVDAGLVSLVIIGVLNSLVSVYYYLRVIVAMYMKSERQPTESILESMTGPREHGLQGPGAMAATNGTEDEEPAPPPFLMERGGWAARLVVVLCVVATLWLGVGSSVGSIPGVERLLEWTETAVQTLR